MQFCWRSFTAQVWHQWHRAVSFTVTDDHREQNRRAHTDAPLTCILFHGQQGAVPVSERDGNPGSHWIKHEVLSVNLWPFRDSKRELFRARWQTTCDWQVWTWKFQDSDSSKGGKKSLYFPSGSCGCRDEHLKMTVCLSVVSTGEISQYIYINPSVHKRTSFCTWDELLKLRCFSSQGSNVWALLSLQKVNLHWPMWPSMWRAWRSWRSWRRERWDDLMARSVHGENVCVRVLGKQPFPRLQLSDGDVWR